MATWTPFPSGPGAAAAGRSNPGQRGCGNPDADPQGDWCPVDFLSCARPGQVAGRLNASLNYYDYCVPRSSNATSQPAAAPAAAGADATSGAGGAGANATGGAALQRLTQQLANAIAKVGVSARACARAHVVFMRVRAKGGTQHRN